MTTIKVKMVVTRDRVLREAVRRVEEKVGEIKIDAAVQLVMAESESERQRILGAIKCLEDIECEIVEEGRDLVGYYKDYDEDKELKSLSNRQFKDLMDCVLKHEIKKMLETLI